MTAIAIVASAILVVAAAVMLYAMVRAMLFARVGAREAWAKTTVPERRFSTVVVGTWLGTWLAAFGITWASTRSVAASAAAAGAVMIAWAVAAPIVGRRFKGRVGRDE